MMYFGSFKSKRIDIMFELWSEGEIKDSVTNIFENGCEDILKRFG
jgi:hypothetical protein